MAIKNYAKSGTAGALGVIAILLVQIYANMPTGLAGSLNDLGEGQYRFRGIPAEHIGNTGPTF